MFDIVEHTREEWRELGYYYEFDKNIKRWRLVGSRSGLSNLVTQFRDFATRIHQHSLGEHDHLGPYSYFTLVLADAPAITDYGVFGSADDFVRFAHLLEEGLKTALPGRSIVIDNEYSTENEAWLELFIEGDNFDPSEADDFEWANR
jgi:hypothetical protein